MKGDRLLSILLLLQNHGKLTTKQLADKLEVSQRTIARDMDALSSAGVPVYAERGTNGGWELSDQYRTDLTGMKTEELIALLFSSQSRLLQDLGMHKHYEGAVEKLIASSPGSIRQHADRIKQKIHIDGAGWHLSEETFPCLPVIQEAIWEQSKLQIRYDKDNETKQRTVAPLGLVAKGNVWYLVASADDDVKSYRISRLKQAMKLEEHFTYPAHFELASYWELSTNQFMRTLPQYPASIRMNEEAFKAFKHRRYVQIISASAGKGIVSAEIMFQTLESACQLLLSYGADAEAIRPPELRMQMKKAVQAMSSLYEDD
ncbi:WYL domain-containing protein [Paenibacillus sp. NEAU-GSW1]|nr:WYL domain-containing protein [Paenibacillus sp. NEAU-GSW1]